MDTDSSSDTLHSTPPAPQLLLWSGTFLLSGALTFGVIGLCVGAALGKFVPGYYQSVFPNGHDPDFDPLAVGVGQGLTQGVILGAIIGLIIVAVYWRANIFARPTAAARTHDLAASKGYARSHRFNLFILGVVVVVIALPAFGIGYVCGLLGNDVSRGNRDVEQVVRIIAGDPARFGLLTIDRGPADKFILEGSVPTQADLDALRDRLIREFGEDRTEFVLGGVTVRS
jgi:hypothetical protein